MTNQRTLSQSILQVLFSVFLGLVVTGFVAIAVNTVLAEPSYLEGVPDDNAWQSWRMATSVALLIAATLIMVVALLLGDRVAVLANGALLGGVFTMIYAVGVAIWAGNQWPRLAIIAVALVVSVAVGYWRFSQRRSWPAPAEGSAPAGPATKPEGEAVVADGALDARITAVETKLDAIARALSSGT